MDQRLRQLSESLRAMRSEEAATWLMETYKIDDPTWGDAIVLLPHRSWAKADQLKLARYYLQRLPYASERPYKAFASFMSFSSLVTVLREYVPRVAPDRLSLLHHHLAPLLEQHAKNDGDLAVSRELLAEIHNGMHPK
jgi:hypothetical protein